MAIADINVPAKISATVLTQVRKIAAINSEPDRKTLTHSVPS